MATGRDELLQQLGITQWILRKPSVLQGEVAINLEHIRLLIVMHQPTAMTDPLLVDILSSMGFMAQQVLMLTSDQVSLLSEDTQCLSWRLGIRQPLALAGVQLSSPPLADLYEDAAAKRTLWQQICHYEPYFSFSSAGSDNGFAD